MSGRHAPRSKNGCQTCRQRKVKCDENRPICNRCSRLNLGCVWGFPGKHGGSKSLQIRHAQATAKSRYLYWAYLRRNYGGGGQSPSTTKELLAREGCSSSATIFSSKTPWLWGEGIQSSPPPVSIAEFFPPHHRIMELSSSEMTCANALTMTAADWVYFRYFPSSFIVFYFMKSWEWSSLGFLYKGPAATNKIIMRMMIAIAANDMHRQGYFSTTAEKEEARRRAQYHYELAVQEFRQYLEEHGRSAPNESGKAEREGLGSTAETILCIMFLMISYEWYFGHSVKHFQLHLEGVRCLLKAHPEIFVTRDVTDTMLTTGAKLNNGRSFTSSQLLLWILYMEIACHPRGLTGSLYNTLLESGHSSLHPDYLHQCARIWGRCLWAEDYPDTQILDDMENHRALELLHHTIMIWNKIWQLAIGNNKDPTTTPETLYSEMMSIRSLFSDVFLTAKFSTSLSSHRSLYTMYFAVCCFESQILYHRRIFSRTQNNIDRQAVTNILEMLYKQYSVEPKLLQRMPWVIFMVMIETEDPIHRDWAMERLRELRHLHEGHAYINLVVDEVVERQRVCGPGEVVNLLEILQRQYKRHV